MLTLLVATLPATAHKEVELNEVIVKGSRTVERTDGQWIYPNRQQLDNSTNGYSLLAKMALPHLRIDPTMHTITPLTNIGGVQVRINDIVATQEDLMALDVKAVQRIEYIDNPGVRYGEGIAYVVNIVVKKATGGYVVGTDLTNTLTAVNGDESFFVKTNRGKSELGVNYTIDYRNFKGMQYDEQTAYELESGDIYHVNRHLVAGQNKNLNHRTQITYNLSDSNYVFQAKLSARRDIQPQRNYSQMQTNNNIFEDHSSSRSSSPVLDLFFNRRFARHQSLTANVVGTHIKTDTYTEHNEGGHYEYAVAGKTWSLWSEAIYENKLKPFMLSLGLQSGQKYIHNEYSGDTKALNDIHSSNIYLFGQLKGHLGQLGYMAGMGVSNYYYRQDSHDYRFWLFRPKFTVTCPVAKGLKLKYDFEVSQHVSQIALVSNVSIKQNAMETLVGNPDIRPNRVTSHDLRLTYSTPRLTSQLQGYYRMNAHCNMEKYSRQDGQFYQTQDNADNKCSFFFLQSYNRWDIVPEHFSATVYGTVSRFFNFTDDYRHTYTAFIGGASMEAYLGKWTLAAYFDSGWNFMEGEHRGHQSADWYLSASYRLKNLTLSLYAQHPFCENPRSDKAEVLNRYIHKEVTRHNRDFGNMITLNVSWNFSSGRKYRDIQRTMNHQDQDTGILQSK